MASIALLRMATWHLRPLSLRNTRGLPQLMEQWPRCCYDDNKQYKTTDSRPKSSSDRKVSKAIGPAVNLLEKDLQSLLEDRQHQEKLQPRRSSLERRLDLLLSLGCSMDQIQNKVKVLDLSERVVMERATMLKDIGCPRITVNLLLSPRFSSLDILRKHVSRREELDAAVCRVLHCSPDELDRLKAWHPSLNRFRCLTAQDITQKAQLLHSYGVTTEEIKAFPGILNVKIENIKHRLDTLKALREEGKLSFDQYPLNTVSLRTRGFESCVENAILGRAHLDGSRITLDTIAQRLNVTAKDIENATINFYKLGPSSALKKIDYLLGEGMSSADIVSHIYIMKHRLQTLHRAMEKSKSVVVSPPPSIYILLSFLRSGHLPKKNFVWSRQRTFVASLFGLQSKELPKTAFLRPLWSADRVCIKSNFDFLVSEGFSPDDIFSCLMVLAHDPGHLQAYYHSLWDRAELAEHAESEERSDKKQTLSLLQYVIEKDMNFASSVFHAEVEVGPESSEKQLPVEDGSHKQEPQSAETSLVKE